MFKPQMNSGGNICGMKNNDDFFKSRIELIENKINTLNCKYITFVSTQIRTEWISLYGNIISQNKVILNSCDYDLFNYINIYKHSKKIKIATIGSFSSLKGQEIVIQSLIKSNIDFIYYCVGSSSISDRNKYKNFNSLNKSKIIFIDYLSPIKLKYFYNALDYTILMSSSEGFGLVILESIACGTPVIIPEYLPIVKEKNILNKSNSIILKSRDINLLVNLFNNIHNFTFLKENISNNLNKNFNWEIVSKNYIKIYNE
jgi:glycosyltransferase involved in cell wall biosynthesis